MAVSDDPQRQPPPEKSTRGGGGSMDPSSPPGGPRPPPPPYVGRHHRRVSTLCIRHSDINATLPDPSSSAGDSKLHVDIEYREEECAITSERLERARGTFCLGDNGKSSDLTSEEIRDLQREQRTIRKTLFLPCAASDENGSAAPAKSIKDLMQLALVDEGEEEEDEDEEEEEVAEAAASKPQDPFEGGGNNKSMLKRMKRLGAVKAKLLTAKLRARVDRDNDGVLGVQQDKSRPRMLNSMHSTRSGKFMAYNMARMSGKRALNAEGFEIELEEEEGGGGEAREEAEKAKDIDVEDISYVRKPNLAKIIEEYDALQNHPKYNLKQVVFSRRFHLYAHRFGNAQYQRTLVYPTLRQPEELYTCPWLKDMTMCGECTIPPAKPPRVTEKQRTRKNGHRFIIAADTQFGILMDGFAMDFPTWSQEIEISRKCVAQINAMKGRDRPLFVCVCGDLVDTEASFSGAIASWKKVMSGWERNLVFQQQVKDFKRVWAQLHEDIALVCLCGNHDVGNRPTRASIDHWTSSFGDEYLAFWANASYNICLNNCLFSNPTGAPDMFDEQLRWMEDQLSYARKNNATHIFVYGHFPWFLKHEEEADDFLTSYSAAPAGWGPPGSSFADSYFTVPYETRKIAMDLFRKYDVTACFSGHFHQNVVAKSSWGMPMIVTGPLSMNFDSDIAHELANGETNGIGMRVVDVGERGKFEHRWMLLDDANELYESGIKRCVRQSMVNILSGIDEKGDGDDDYDDLQRQGDVASDEKILNGEDDDDDVEVWPTPLEVAALQVEINEDQPFRV